MNAPLYNAEILRLAASIPHGERLDAPHASVRRTSPICGSRVTADVRMDRQGRVAAFGQEVRACALGQASAAILGDGVIGRDAATLREAHQALVQWLKGEDPLPDLLATQFPRLQLMQPARAHGARHASIALAFDAAASAAEEALATIDQILAGHAGSWEPLSQYKLEQAIDVWVDRIDPGALRRTRYSARGRDVSIGAASPESGTASLWGRLLASDASLLERRLSEMAHALCEDDPRTVGQRRADALGALAAGAQHLTCRCESGECPSPAPDGRAKTVIEAVSEGVLLSSLTHSMQADYVAVLRPRVGQRQIATAIVRAFANLGKAYDFNFDFEDTSKLVCSQVVYLSYADAIDLPLQRVLGRTTMPANEIARKYAAEASKTNRQLDLVLFLDADPRRGVAVESTAAEFGKSVTRPRELVETP